VFVVVGSLIVISCCRLFALGVGTGEGVIGLVSTVACAERMNRCRSEECTWTPVQPMMMMTGPCVLIRVGLSYLFATCFAKFVDAISGKMLRPRRMFKQGGGHPCDAQIDFETELATSR
jgi:hypothetical protein